ncbi:MAG TPA: glycosyltransferase family 39 protein [Blastocatellia bacterium]|nr:glycosyltransferase family 39 protein [Blastocatellia bacterium]
MFARANGTTDQAARQTGQDEAVETKDMLLAFAGIFVLNLLLRAFYLRFDFVNGDEGVRALTAVRVLEGARLYADIVTDKPPGTTYFYAAVFALFGRSMTAVHLASAVWNFATAVVASLIASRLYGRRTGLWAALILVFFSTTYLTQDMMAANTELLMALPYTAAFYYYVAASGLGRAKRDSSMAGFVIAGAMTGFATLFKQVGVFNLAFFAAHEIFSACLDRDKNKGGSISWIGQAARRGIPRLLLIGAGFVMVLALFALWLVISGSFAGFWRNAVVLNLFYISSVPSELWLRFMIGRTLGYIFFNAALWALAVWVVARAIKGVRKKADYADAIDNRSDLAVTLWGAASLAAVFAGGRFFGHYFIQVLPALCILAARGLRLLAARLRAPRRSRKARAAAFALAAAVVFSFVRFHQRTAILAYEAVTGNETHLSQSWGMTVREREAEVVSKYVSSHLAAGEPLYIWEYALDVYWLTKCQPASRYLSPYYITGRFPDAGQKSADPGESFWREARAHLIEDLKRSRPRMILDVYGRFLELPYPELVAFVKENYEYETRVGLAPGRPFFVFRLKENRQD